MTYYTKHRVLLWKRLCWAGVRTRLGGAKRVMLSLADCTPLPAGRVEEGMMNLGSQLVCRFDFEAIVQ
jgi:hypothetical protein